MGWVVATRSLLPAAVASAASAASDGSRRRSKPDRRTGPVRPKQPSVAEVRRAIGVDFADELSSSRSSNPSSASSSSPSSSFMEFLSSTPIGDAESPAERKLRETAEWVVEHSETKAVSGQKVLIMVCLKILPVWLMLLLVASGIIKLPFDVPFIDELIS